MESEPPIFKLRNIAEERRKELGKILFEKAYINDLHSRRNKRK